MKTRIFMLLTVAATAGLLITACQKEQQTDGPASLSTEQVYTPKASKLVQEINSFKQKMTIVRENPHLKSGELMSKEEARWNIETLFNVTYGFPDDAYGRTVSDSTTVYLPVDASGNALLEDVVAVYDQIHDLVSQFYLSHNFEEKGFLFMQLQSGDVVNGQLEIELEAVTGARFGTTDDPPVQNFEYFLEGEDWKYGYNLGSCDETILGTDAAKQLDWAVWHSMYWWPEPPAGFRWMTANLFTIELTGFEYTEGDDYLIFYIEKPQGENFTEEEICLDHNEMNHHYNGEMTVIHQLVPNDPAYPQFGTMENWVLLKAEIEGLMQNNEFPHYIHHYNKLRYAELFLVPIIEIPVPIELVPDEN